MKRLLLTCALIAGALATAPAAQAGELDWKPCGDRFQCADLKVPLDYSRPWWHKIEIPVIKLPATDTERRIGAMVGGPAAARAAASGGTDLRRIIRRERRLGSWGMPVPALAGR